MHEVLEGVTEVIREVPTGEWGPFLERFGREHRAWLATVHVVDARGHRDPLCSDPVEVGGCLGGCRDSSSSSASTHRSPRTALRLAHPADRYRASSRRSRSMAGRTVHSSRLSSHGHAGAARWTRPRRADCRSDFRPNATSCGACDTLRVGATSRDARIVAAFHVVTQALIATTATYLLTAVGTLPALFLRSAPRRRWTR